MFLIRKESEVIAQLPIEKEFLLNRYCKLGDFMGTDKIRKYLAKKQRRALANSIKSLRAGMNNVNLKAKVLEVAKPTRVVTRYGNIASVAKVLIGDETGTVNLCLWNEQIGDVSVGDFVQIKNAQTSMFRGERLLSLGKKGTLNNEDLKPPLKSMKLLTAAL